MSDQPTPVTPPPVDYICRKCKKAFKQTERYPFSFCEDCMEKTWPSATISEWCVSAIDEVNATLSGILTAETCAKFAAIIQKHAPARSQTGEGVEQLETDLERATDQWILAKKDLQARIAELEAENATTKNDLRLLEGAYAIANANLKQVQEWGQSWHDLAQERLAQLRAPTPAPSCPTEQGELVERLKRTRIDVALLAESIGVFRRRGIDQSLADAISALSDPPIAPVHRELASLLQQMLDVAENCDETGYAEGEGFVNLDELHDKVRAALSRQPAPSAVAKDRAEVELNEIARAAYENSKAHGFWEQPRNKGEMLALIHSEVSECLEGVRKDLPDDHLPDTTMEAAELADIIIRVGDYAHGFGIDLQKVVAAKMKFNASRPYKHGKTF